jgi:hypothetical protein
VPSATMMHCLLCVQGMQHAAWQLPASCALAVDFPSTCAYVNHGILDVNWTLGPGWLVPKANHLQKWCLLSCSLTAHCVLCSQVLVFFFWCARAGTDVLAAREACVVLAQWCMCLQAAGKAAELELGKWREQNEQDWKEDMQQLEGQMLQVMGGMEGLKAELRVSSGRSCPVKQEGRPTHCSRCWRGCRPCPSPAPSCCRRSRTAPGRSRMTSVASRPTSTT